MPPSRRSWCAPLLLVGSLWPRVSTHAISFLISITIREIHHLEPFGSWFESCTVAFCFVIIFSGVWVSQRLCGFFLIVALPAVMPSLLSSNRRCRPILLSLSS
ncbi:hypothetical protein V6N13_037994 [Hibiscus sabdariffa]|uniref:Secreted peptide n=1 Tax=Hibiscus sabdariffa TaxID=183260 RepID=A0ABR2S4A2_9ROSI